MSNILFNCPGCCDESECVGCNEYVVSIKMHEMSKESNKGKINSIYGGCHMLSSHFPCGYRMEINFCQGTPKELKFSIIGAIALFGYRSIFS